MRFLLYSASFLSLAACATTSEEIGGNPHEKVKCYEKYAFDIMLRQSAVIEELQQNIVERHKGLGERAPVPPEALANMEKANGTRKLFGNCLKDAGVVLPKEEAKH